jgi:hypothetical protein
MRKGLFILLFLIAIPSLALGRLGETEQQTLSRYGELLKNWDYLPPILNKAVTRSYKFQGWAIRVAYLNGHAVRIVYSKLSGPNVSPQLKDDEINAVLNAEVHGGEWKKIQPGTLFGRKESGNKLFDFAIHRWVNTNKNIAYIPLAGLSLYVETPIAAMWEQTLENDKEVKRKESIPNF